MARRGVWQLQKLVINYCEFSGSSRGTREFVREFLPLFQEQNPQLAVEAAVRRGHHPFLAAEYLGGSSRAVDLRNKEPGEVLRQAAYLRSCTGRKASLQVKKRTRTATPSVQGPWTSELQDRLKAQQAQQAEQQAQQ